MEIFQCLDNRNNRTVSSDKTKRRNTMITLIGTLPPIKGLSPYCSELLKALSRCIKVEFIGFKSIYPEFLYSGGTKIKDKGYRMPSMENASIRNMLTWYNPFSWLWAGFTLRGDVVHAQWWAYSLAPVFFAILLVAKLRKKVVVITVHNVLPHERNWLSKFLNGIVLLLGDRFIVHSGENKENLSKIYDIPKRNIFVIPMGILEPVSAKGISQKDARVFLGISPDKKVILHFGNIRDYKGLDILLESAKAIKREIDIILLVAGKPWNKWKKYEEIIMQNGLSDCVIKKLDFIPPSEVEYYFSSTDVVVLPYKYFDSQSAVGALTLPFRKPLIVTNVGGLPDFVKDERAVAKPNDAQDLAEKVINVLKDEALLSKLAEDSGELLEKFGWEGIAEKTLGVYLGCDAESILSTF